MLQGICTHIISLLKNLQEENNYKKQLFSLWIRLKEILACNNKRPKSGPFSLNMLNIQHIFTLFLKAWYLLWFFKWIFNSLNFLKYCLLNKYYGYFHKVKCIGLTPTKLPRGGASPTLQSQPSLFLNCVQHTVQSETRLTTFSSNLRMSEQKAGADPRPVTQVLTVNSSQESPS